MKSPLIVAISLIVLAASVSVMFAPPTASAQNTVNVIEQGVENQFPDGLRFYISAASASDIQEIRVYVQKLGQSSRSTYRHVEFEPGQTVDGEALFQSKTAREYIPPGTRLSYYFEIRTADGSVAETSPETVVYLNTGLNWQSTSIGLINVYYYELYGRSKSNAEAVLAAAVDTYVFMRPILGVELTEPMNIVVYSDYGHMEQALPPTSQVASQRLRTLGKAFTNERTLVVDGSLSNILDTAAHEFTHLLVADAAGSAYSGVHNWLNEGLAVYSERDSDSEFNRYIASAIRRDDVPPLAGLITFAGTPSETLLNYGQGHAVVKYMIDTYGEEKMAELFADLPRSRDTARALVNTFGLTIDELDNEWRESVGLEARVRATPELPPLQVPATSRPSIQAPEQPTATPAPLARAQPTYTPRPAPQLVDPAPAPTTGGCNGPAPGDSATIGVELGSLALLALPVGFGAIIGIRRRR